MDNNIQRLSLAILFSASFFAAKTFADPAPVVQGNLASPTAAVAEQTLVTANSSDTTQAQVANAAAMQNLPPSELQLYNQVQQMQQQMRDLQGQLEVQSHQIQVLQQQVKPQPTQTSAAAANPALAATPAPAATPASATTATDISQDVTSSNAAPAKQTLTEQAQYEQAYQLLVDKKYDQAEIGLQNYLKEYPNGQYASNAHYWLGELYLVSGNSNQALSQFQTVVNKFDDSNKVADAMLKIGYIYYLDQQYKTSATELQKLIKDYPTSSSAKLAKEKLDMMQSSGNI